MPTFGLYETLRVSRDASREEIAKAFRTRSLESMRRGENGAAINKAYRVLSDPKLRARYDERGDAMLDSIDFVGPDPQVPTEAEVADVEKVLRDVSRATRRTPTSGSSLSRWLGLGFFSFGALGLVWRYFDLRGEIAEHAPRVSVGTQFIVLCDVLVVFGLFLVVTGFSLQTDLGKLSFPKRAGLVVFSIATLVGVGVSSYVVYDRLIRAGYREGLPPMPEATYPSIQPQPIPVPSFTSK